MCRNVGTYMSLAGFEFQCLQRSSLVDARSFRAPRQGRRALSFISVLFSCWLNCAAATTTISGTVTTTAGKPIRAAVTVHDVSTARVQGQAPFDRQYASKSDGTFLFLNVPRASTRSAWRLRTKTCWTPACGRPPSMWLIFRTVRRFPVWRSRWRRAICCRCRQRSRGAAAGRSGRNGGAGAFRDGDYADEAISQFSFARCERDGAGPLFAGAVRSDFDAGDSEFEPGAERCAESALQRGCAAGSGADTIGRVVTSRGGECGWPVRAKS